MARRRFFVDTIRGGVAELRGDEARHLTRVLRVEPGQRFELSDNQSAYLAEIQEARGERVVFRVLETIPGGELPLHLTLCTALVKFDRFEWMIEKTTELGIERILPVESTRSERGLFEASRKRMERWHRVARESSQQSRRLRLPEIAAAIRFEQALTVDVDYRYFLEEESGAEPLLRVLPDNRKPADKVALLVGPEGGWVDAERRSAVLSGWRAVSLGAQVLRAETAAMAAVAVILNAWTATAITTIE